VPYNFKKPKIGQTNGLMADTGAPVSVDDSFKDIRIHGFVYTSALCVLACNRGGPAGEVGEGTNWVLPASLSTSRTG
jgi:hypothetical protein